MRLLNPVVDCKYCPTPLLLWYPNPPEILQGQPVWPNRDWKENIACHECGFVSEYSAQDVRWGAFDKSFLDQLRQRPSFFRVEIECAEKDCKARIEIHFCAMSGTTADDVVRKIYESKAVAAICSHGHAANSWNFRGSCDPER